MRVLIIFLLLIMTAPAFAGKHKQHQYKAGKEYQSKQYSRMPGIKNKRRGLHL